MEMRARLWVTLLVMSFVCVAATPMWVMAICKNPPCHPVEPPGGAPPVCGNVFPNYMVLTVLYAPPGSNGGSNATSVTYSSESSTGTQVTIGSTFKTSVSTTVEASSPFFSASTSFGASSTDGYKQSVQVKKTAGLDLKVSATTHDDGINHDDDVIYLWLNPVVHTCISGEEVTWTPDVAGPAMILQWVKVSELRHPETMRPPVASTLAMHGITRGDYPEILKADPFAQGATTIDRTRFVPTTWALPYEPPVGAGESVPSSTVRLTNEANTQETNSHQEEESVGYKVSAGGGFGDLWKAKVETSTTFSWTQSTEETNSVGDKQGCSATIGGPALGYDGPTILMVYWDTLFDSFMFAFLSETEAVASGAVMDAGGQPVPYCLVTATANGKTFRTLTDAHGRYHIVGAPAGPARIVVLDQVRETPFGPNAPNLEIRVKSASKDVVKSATLEINRSRLR